MARRGFMRSGNPFLSDKAIQKATDNVLDDDFTNVGYAHMTVGGAANKTMILGAILLFFAIINFTYANMMLTIVGAIGGLILAFAAAFKPQNSNIIAPVYSILEGLFVGGITALFASSFNGIVANAIMLTMALFFGMLFLYKAKIIKVTAKFRSILIMATFGVVAIYLASWVMSFFGMSIPFIHETGLMGIGISIVFIAIASLNLLLDFDNFEQGEANRLPANMEWFFAMGLIITVVWLYIEVLRLLAKLQND